MILLHINVIMCRPIIIYLWCIQRSFVTVNGNQNMCSHYHITGTLNAFLKCPF